MILLATGDTLAAEASASSKLTCTVFGMTLNGGVESYGVLDQRQLNVTAETIYTAPAGTTAFIRNVTVVNTDLAASYTFQLFRGGISAVNAITPVFMLGAGDSAVYEDSVGWSIITVKAGTEFLNDIHSGYSDYQTIANPATPPADTLRIFARKASGRTMPKWMPPSGMDTYMQPALFGNNIVLWQPGATSGVMLGSVGTAIGTGVATLPTLTNVFTALRRSVFTVATGINLQNSYRSDNLFFRGGGLGGGFFCFIRFGLSIWTPGNRLFVGFTANTTALTTANPSSLSNIIGFGADSGDTEISFMHNDALAGASKIALPSGQPALSTNNGYDAYIFCKPNDTTIYYRLDNINTGEILVDTFINSGDLPLASFMMNVHVAIGSGSNAGSNIAAIGINRIYVESDY